MADLTPEREARLRELLLEFTEGAIDNDRGLNRDELYELACGAEPLFAALDAASARIAELEADLEAEKAEVDRIMELFSARGSRIAELEAQVAADGAALNRLYDETPGCPYCEGEIEDATKHGHGHCVSAHWSPWLDLRELREARDQQGPREEALRQEVARLTSERDEARNRAAQLDQRRHDARAALAALEMELANRVEVPFPEGDVRDALRRLRALLDPLPGAGAAPSKRPFVKEEDDAAALHERQRAAFMAREACLYCEGRGERLCHDNFWRKCRHCSGTGKAAKYDAPCAACGGAKFQVRDRPLAAWRAPTIDTTEAAQVDTRDCPACGAKETEE